MPEGIKVQQRLLACYQKLEQSVLFPFQMLVFELILVFHSGPNLAPCGGIQQRDVCSSSFNQSSQVLWHWSSFGRTLEVDWS